MKIVNLKYYWFLIFLILIIFYRLDISCLHKDCQLEESRENSLVNLSIFNFLRARSISIIDRSFPSPYSELLLGMTIGIDKLVNVPNFKNALKKTGTIHVVVVSGFNISLVFSSILMLLGSKYELKNLLISQFFTFLYALLSGFEPPVIRALIMGSILSWGAYFGRGVETLLVLLTSGAFMVALNPLYLFNLSFILSFTATLSLILFSPLISQWFSKGSFLLIEDFVSSLSAQILVWPIISHSFGSVSLMSVFVNSLILWTVPLTTILGSVFLLVSFCNEFLGSLFLIPLYILMKIFIEVVMAFSNLNIGFIEFKLSSTFIIVYYCIVGVFLLYGYKNKTI